MVTFSRMTATEIVALIRRRAPDGSFGVSFAEACDLIECFGRCEAAAAALDATNESYTRVQVVLEKFDKERERFETSDAVGA